MWVALGATVAAAVLHFLVAPVHADHAPAHAIAFVTIGVFQLAWSAAYLLRPDRWTWLLGLALHGGSMALWGLTRVVRAPFEEHAEAVDLGGLLTKGAELAAVGALLAVPLTVAGAALGRGAWRLGAAGVVAGVVLAGASYGAAIAAEPVFPGLDAGHEHAEDDRDEGTQHETTDPSGGHDGIGPSARPALR